MPNLTAEQDFTALLAALKRDGHEDLEAELTAYLDSWTEKGDECPEKKAVLCFMAADISRLPMILEVLAS